MRGQAGRVMCWGSGVTGSSKLSGMKGKRSFMAADKEEDREGSASIREDQSLSRPTSPCSVYHQLSGAVRPLVSSGSVNELVAVQKEPSATC